jgi:2',5'-phosphodiesterase
MLEASPELTLALQQKVTTVAQITLLAPVDEEPPIVADSIPRVSRGSTSSAAGDSGSASSGDDLSSGPSGSQRILCVVNTHLFYHPYAPHIRTIHTSAILEEAVAFMSSDEMCGPGISGSVNPDRKMDTDVLSEVPQPGSALQLASLRRGQGQSLQQGQSLKPALLFCGDLNSDLNDGVPGNECIEMRSM